MIRCVTVGNDNNEYEVRPLSSDDEILIAAEFAKQGGFVVDSLTLASEDAEINEIVEAVFDLIPDLQRAIAWRGSWLKRSEIDALDDAKLNQACCHVLAATLSEYRRDSINEYLKRELSPFSSYVRGEAA